LARGQEINWAGGERSHGNPEPHRERLARGSEALSADSEHREVARRQRVRHAAQLENLYLLTRESMVKSGLSAYHDHLQATNKFYLAAVVLSDAGVDTCEARRIRL
jgi:hypothetical protein